MTDWLSPRLTTNDNRMVVEGKAQLEAVGIGTDGKTSEQILIDGGGLQAKAGPGNKG
jgi:hypothetical protein